MQRRSKLLRRKGETNNQQSVKLTGQVGCERSSAEKVRCHAREVAKVRTRHAREKKPRLNSVVLFDINNIIQIVRHHGIDSAIKKT